MDEKEIIPTEIPLRITGDKKYGHSTLNNHRTQISLGDQKFFEKRIACEWLSTKEAAHFLSISENALRIMVHRNQVPTYKFGRRLRFRQQDCLALIQVKGA